MAAAATALVTGAAADEARAVYSASTTNLGNGTLRLTLTGSNLADDPDTNGRVFCDTSVTPAQVKLDDLDPNGGRVPTNAGVQCAVLGEVSVTANAGDDLFRFEGEPSEFPALTRGTFDMGNGADRVDGTHAADTIRGGAGGDDLEGARAARTDQANLVVGGDGDDTLEGGSADDALFGDQDTGVGGTPGTDRAIVHDNLQGGNFAGRISLVPSEVTGVVDAVTGTMGTDSLTSVEQVSVEGTAGADVLSAGALPLGGGVDRVTLDAGINGIVGDAAPDTLVGGAGGGQVENGDPTDRFSLDLGATGRTTGFPTPIGASAVRRAGADDWNWETVPNVTITATNGADCLDASDADDALLIALGAGADSLNASGTNARQTVDGGAGNDLVESGVGVLRGGAGDDVLAASDVGAPTPVSTILEGGPGADRLTAAATNRGTVTARVTGGRVTATNTRLVSATTGTDTLGAGIGDIDLAGSAGPDLLDARANTLHELELNDGGAGGDTLLAGAGEVEEFEGEEGDDRLVGSPVADDDLEGGPGNDTLLTGAGDEADDVEPGPGNDVVDLGPGNDEIDSGTTADPADGAGNDTISGGPGNDELDAGTGVDVVRETLTAAGTITAGASSLGGARGSDTLTAVERLDLTGSAGDDAFLAPSFPGAVRFLGAAGDDTLVAGRGADTLDGGAGADALTAGAGNDLLTARDGTTDALACGAGTDRGTADRIDGRTDCEDVLVPPPPPDPPDPVDVTPPELALGRPALSRRGVLTVRLTCDEAEACEVRVRVDATGRRDGRRTRIRLARRTLALEAGESRRLRVALSRRARRSLRRLTRPRIVIRAVAEDAAGNVTDPVVRTRGARLRGKVSS